MIEPLRMSFVVDCPVDHAYDTWTAARWWPMSHTMTGTEGLRVRFEARPGGRIFERSPSGEEVDFGEVITCDRPHRLVYLWHMRTTREDATEVEIRFVASGEDATLVEIEHRGWERLGERGSAWRERNQAGWDGLVPHYLAAASTS